MIRFRNILSLVLFCLSVLSVQAQMNGCNSSYSMFGLGLLNDQSDGLRKSMAGAGLGVRVGNRLNTGNPASYSAIDSLSFIMDVGMKGSFGKMTQNAKTVAVNNATLDYVHVGFRIVPRLGFVAGFQSYSSIGYDFSSPEKTIVNDANTTLPIASSNGFSGEGGLSQVYAGLGWNAFRNLSVGVNASFLWGDYRHFVGTTFTEGGNTSSSYSSAMKVSAAKLRTYKIDLGAQYPVQINADNKLTLGAVVSMGHKIAQDADLLRLTSMGDTTTLTAKTPFDLPWTFGGGVAWERKNNLLVAADIHHESWGKCHAPVETSTGYEAMTGTYKNRVKMAAGAQWIPNPYDKRYWQCIQYRAGISYSTPYMKVNGQNGPYELSMHIGAGLPFRGSGSQSMVNVGLQWLKRSASGPNMVHENYLLVNVGVVFNERWFQKYKIQ